VVLEDIRNRHISNEATDRHDTNFDMMTHIDPYLSNGSSDRCEIWQGDLYYASAF